MTTTKKIVWSYLDYVSTPNVHAACFIFTSVTLHINVWYRKIWWANYATLPTFTLHTRFWTQFLKLYLLTPTEDKFLNWENANSIVTSVEFRKKEERAFLKHSHTNGNCKTDFLAQLKAPSQHWTLVTCWVQKEQTGLAVLVVARKALEDKVQWRFENSSLQDGNSDLQKTQTQSLLPIYLRMCSGRVCFFKHFKKLASNSCTAPLSHFENAKQIIRFWSRKCVW